MQSFCPAVADASQSMSLLVFAMYLYCPDVWGCWSFWFFTCVCMYLPQKEKQSSTVWGTQGVGSPTVGWLRP